MNILLMGCSYAVPNYFGPPGAPTEDHTEYLLRQAGHQVHNCGQNGIGNMVALYRARDYLKGLEIEHPARLGKIHRPAGDLKIDLVIWFHTELYRDYTRYPKDQLVGKIYDSYKNFFSTLDCPYIIIGGAGDLDPTWIDFFEPEMCIPSWRREILGTDLPLSNSLWSRQAIVDDDSMSMEEKIQIFDNDLEIRQRLEDSTDFPDNAHPGTGPHQDLTRRILTVV